MGQPIVKYNGDHVTCYPSSNAVDDGKLNLEFNMARIVTRLSSKNFCIVKPSFELSVITNITTGTPVIQVGIGQASINGMDLIMNDTITIDPPESEGTYHLAFKLARDSSSNVLGDLVYGMTTTFEGVYLTYYEEKPDPMDMDMLFLGQVTWDGNEFTEVVEDEDKYGRIWAEDILCKLEDPKHPDIGRLNLQEWLYKVPDWYMSKEGDTMYGPLILADNRTNNNPGIIFNVTENGSYITVKDPSIDNDKLQLYGDVNHDGVIDLKDYDLVYEFINGTKVPTDLQSKLADVNHDGLIDEKDIQYILNFINKDGNGAGTGNIYNIENTDNGITIIADKDKTGIEVGPGELYSDLKDNVLHLHNKFGICIDGEGPVSIQGKQEVLISTDGEKAPQFKATDESISILNPLSPDILFNFAFKDENKAQFTLGKAIWEYNNETQIVSLLQNDVAFLNVVPNADFSQSIRVKEAIYLGDKEFSTNNTYLKPNIWRLADSDNKYYTQFTPNGIEMVDPNGNGSSTITLINPELTRFSKIYDNGKIELQNNVDNPVILFKEGIEQYNISIEKIKGAKKLNITGNVDILDNLVVKGTSTGNGFISTNGSILLKNGTNDATIIKDLDSPIITTSDGLRVGTSGSSNLYAGNTIINGTFSLGGAKESDCEFKIDNDGNLETSGTIRGSKVYNAVYNDAVEFMEKEDYEEDIEAGDVVYFTESGKVTKYNDNINVKSLAGVVSSEETYGYALGGDGLKDNEKVPIALMGRVYLKVPMHVETGDLLSVNKDGMIVISEDINRYTLGKATKPSDDGKVYIKVIN